MSDERKTDVWKTMKGFRDIKATKQTCGCVASDWPTDVEPSGRSSIHPSIRQQLSNTVTAQLLRGRRSLFIPPPPFTSLLHLSPPSTFHLPGWQQTHPSVALLASPFIGVDSEGREGREGREDLGGWR